MSRDMGYSDGQSFGHVASPGAVLKVVAKELSVTAAAAQYGFSRQHLHRLLARYRADGLDAVEPRSRRPRSNPAATSDAVRARIIELRLELTRQGLDAGPVTIGWHLEAEGHRPPATSTIRRLLHAAGLVAAEPRKRPRNSYIRFEADQPNECWQSDFTHWGLADGADVEILNWLDDHSRYLLSCTCHTRVTGTLVIDTFTHCCNTYGMPASTLTDNGSVYTSRFTGGRNGFEYLLAALHIQQKNGHPNHPQTQGKIERFHQTLKRWLTRQPPANDLAELQTQLDQFAEQYNTRRPHRALDRATPAQAYTARPKAVPASTPIAGHFRIRFDHVDPHGKISLRRAGRMHHLGVGITHAREPVLMVIDPGTVTVINRDTGEVLSTHHIQPDHTYWRNQQQSPGRWPGLKL
jgi:transposase InsO family protein